MNKEKIKVVKFDKVPTAEELMQSQNGDDYTHWEEIHAMLIAFAKMHTELALKEAAKIALNKQNPDTRKYVSKKSILNSYPLTNIK